MAGPLATAHPDEKEGEMPGKDALPSESATSSMSSKTQPDGSEDVILSEHDVISKGHGYSLRPKHPYHNNLLAAVGLFELTNALDFPANVWNEIPPKVFAQVLMGLGGTICFLWSSFGVWDLIRSRRNIELLWQERRDLQSRLAEKRTSKSATDGSATLLQAWLDINYRELGWEYVDRAVMDGMMVVAICSGTMLAIRGDIPIIFHTSNLMSGYVGNSFVALYAVINTAWSIYMWRHASKQLAAIRGAKSLVDNDTRTRMVTHARKHQLYAAINAATVLVSGAGSLVSATMWYGYVIIAPCILGSIFCNLFWRYRLGYDRKSYGDWIGQCADFNLSSHLILLHNMRLTIQAEKSVDEQKLDQMSKDRSAMLRTLQHFGLAELFGCCLLSHIARNGSKRITASPRTLTVKDLWSHDGDSVQLALAQVFSITHANIIRDQERFLLELYGCYLVVMQRKASQTAEPEQGSEKVRT